MSRKHASSFSKLKLPPLTVVFRATTIMDSTPPLSSLRLLIPPVRLISASMWQIAQEQHLEHYEHLENFVTLVTKIVPDVLSQRQRTTLIMGLRAKVLLEMCKGDLPVDSQTVKDHLHQIQSSDLVKSRHSEMDSFQSNLLNFILKLLEDPAKKDDFYQRVYPVEYGPDFDKALQVLVCYFISRLEQLLPIPNFKQVASWVNSSCLWDEYKQYTCQTEDLQHLLQHNCHRPLDNNGLPSIVEDRIISALSLPPTEDSDCSQSIFHREPCLDVLRSSSQTHQDNQQTRGLHKYPQGVNTTSDASKEEQGQFNYQSDVDHEDDDYVERQCDLREYERMENETTDGSSIALKCDISRGTMLTATSESCDLEGIAVGKLKFPGTPGQNDDKSFRGVLMDPLTVPLGDFQLTLPVSRCDQTVQEIQAATHPGERIELDAILTLPSQESPQQKTCFMLSGISSNSQDDNGTLKEDPSLDVSNTQVATHSTGKVCSSVGQTKSLGSQQGHRRMPLKCSYCGRNFERMSGLMSHMQTHLDQRDPSPPSSSQETAMKTEAAVEQISQCECRFCGMNFPTVIELKKHLMTHTELKPYHCNYCVKSFVCKSGLNSHMSTHTGEKPYLCEACGKRFCGSSQLKSHMRLHSPDAQHCCPHCGKMYCTLGNLNIHIRAHTGERPFLCSTCGKDFKSAGDLQVHTRFHTGERPYKCQVCDKGFVNSGHRNLHARMHTGERPFSCPVCGKCFMRPGCYKQHMLIHTGERNYKCPECPKSYKRKSHLKIHSHKHKK